MNISTHMKKTGLTHLLILAVCCCLFSCKTQRQAQYLTGPLDSAALSHITVPEPIIQKGDLVGITVYSDNAEASAAFNQQMTTSAASSATQSGGNLIGVPGTTNQTMPGYLVDAAGNIRFQTLGELHVEGLNKAQLDSMLKVQLVKYLKNPYLNIRFLNYKFTMLGEVNRQGVFTVPGEKISILEALGMAGDVTLYALKDSVMVIRETNGKRTFGNLDVTKPEVLLSPYYYLQQNDIVIVKANAKKPSISEQTATRRLAMIATITSILVSLSLILTRIN